MSQEPAQDRTSTEDSVLLAIIDIDTNKVDTTNMPKDWLRGIQEVYRDSHSRRLDGMIEEAKYSMGFLHVEDEVAVQPFVGLAIRLGYVVGVDRTLINPLGWGQFVDGRVAKGSLRIVPYNEKNIVFPAKLRD